MWLEYLWHSATNLESLLLSSLPEWLEREAFSLSSQQVSVKPECYKEEGKRWGERDMCSLSSLKPVISSKKKLRGAWTWDDDALVLVILLMQKNRVEKNNNKGRVRLLLSANTTFCHSLSLCCLLKQTVDKVFSLESGLKEQAIRQHFYSGWALDIIVPSDRTGVLNIRSLTHQIRRIVLKCFSSFSCCSLCCSLQWYIT